jgi:hypothetical protein
VTGIVESGVACRLAIGGMLIGSSANSGVIHGSHEKASANITRVVKRPFDNYRASRVLQQIVNCAPVCDVEYVVRTGRLSASRPPKTRLEA